MKVAYWFSLWKVHLFALTSCIIPEAAWVTRSSTHWGKFALKLHVIFMVGPGMFLYLFLWLCCYSHAISHTISHRIFTLCSKPLYLPFATFSMCRNCYQFAVQLHSFNSKRNKILTQALCGWSRFYRKIGVVKGFTNYKYKIQY